MIKKQVGIIGNSGRMGTLLTNALVKHQCFALGVGFSRSQNPYIPLEEVFVHNDYVVDFAKGELVKELLLAALKTPKPLVLCSTGWQYAEVAYLLEELCVKVPIVIVTNTSIGAYLQRFLVKQLAAFLGNEFDIDILERHHKHKIDIPSGTANSLAKDIQQTKQQAFGLNYNVATLPHGPRPDNVLNIAAFRSGNMFGEHEVTFTSAEEIISIRHVALDRALFARGAIKILEWLLVNNPRPKVYTMEDVFSKNAMI